MKLINGIYSIPKNSGACVATIGNFDGLHLGHQKIINKLRIRAKELSLPLTIISFEPLPSEYFMPQAPERIYPMRDKMKRLKALGVDNYCCLRFNDSLANMSPQDFVQTILLDKLKVKYLAIGDDFRFGHKREGDFNLLKKMGKAVGMEVVDTTTCEHQGERVSSTRIRTHLMAGEISAANELLGHSYQLSGRVRHGDKRGRTIGFPTLNMKVLEHIAAKRGVYAVLIHGLSKEPLKGVANLGARPTVNGSENRLETHVFDFDADVYGKHICVELIKFIRGEKRFENFEQLKAQIQDDAVTAKNILSN